MPAPQWRTLVDHVMSISEKIYETWTSPSGWNNDTPFGVEFGENLVSWCVIFDWDMYHDVGLDAVVPKTDNVGSFSSWAQARGQWSEYPSIGAWVNFGQGAHTEIVVGFDADTVYTKGGNSIQAGATDNGQGNGVWRHSHARRDAYVVGYFAPRFPDGQCPPTADPNDPRGGPAVTSWSWTEPATPATPEEDQLPTPLDVWAYRNAADDAASVQAGHGHIPDAYAYLRTTASAVQTLAAQVGALTATVGALAKAGGLSAAEVQAAAQAGAEAALHNLGAALTHTA